MLTCTFLLVMVLVNKLTQGVEPFTNKTGFCTFFLFPVTWSVCHKEILDIPPLSHYDCVDSMGDSTKSGWGNDVKYGKKIFTHHCTDYEIISRSMPCRPNK